MKKIIAIFLVVVLIMPMCIIPASAEYDGEISFRGIPWGSNYYEVMQKLEELNDTGIEWSESNKERLDLDKTLKDYYTHYMSGEKQFPCILRIEGMCSGQLKVAGKALSYINLYFAYTKDENGILVQDKEHTSFYGAEYRFKGKGNSASKFYDLDNKMTSLYGETSLSTSSSILFPAMHRKVWNGSEQTYAVLFDTGFYVNLLYFWKYGDIIAKDANDYLVEWNQNHPGNTDGL